MSCGAAEQAHKQNSSAPLLLRSSASLLCLKNSQQFVSCLINVAGSESQHEVAGLCDLLQPGGRARKRANVFNVPMSKPLDLFRQSSARYSLDRIFARRIDIRNKQQIRAIKRAREIIRQITSAAVS